MNRTFKTLFTILLGILLIVPTITANSLADTFKQDGLIYSNAIRVKNN